MLVSEPQAQAGLVLTTGVARGRKRRIYVRYREALPHQQEHLQFSIVVLLLGS